MTPARILVVEDSRVVARDLQQQLERIGHQVVATTPSGAEAVELAATLQPQLVLMDIRLEGELDGIEAAQRIRARSLIPVIYLTAYADEGTLARASLTEPFGYLLKPFDESELHTAIEMALYKSAVERRLRADERRYATTLASIADAVVATDRDARITFLNPAAERLTGWSRDEALGRDVGEVCRLIDADTRAPIEGVVARVRGAATQVGPTAGAALVARDGRELPIDDLASPIVDDAGALDGVVLVLRDMTERRRAEEAEALREVTVRIDRAVRGSNIGIWEIEMADGGTERARLSLSNVWEMLGYGDPPPDLDPATLLHPDDRAVAEHAVAAHIAGELAELELEHRIRHRDGTYRWVLMRGVAVRDPAGKVARLVGSTVDITDRKHAEQRWRDAQATAVAANRAKDEFLANVSHEIRTPMNAILGMTELVLGTPLGDGQRQSLATVRSAATSLLGTINDLLDFAKIEAGKLDLDPVEFGLRAALGDTMRALALRAHRKGLELVCNVHPDVPDALVGDVVRLRQIVINLVGNAIKFTTEGEVIVDVAGAGTGDPGHLRVAVRDTGIGIPRAKQAAIFRAFEQEDTSTTRKYGGTGLGLTIAARMIALLGGEIAVDSEPGHGSTFTFTVRFAAQPVPPVDRRRPAARPGLRALVVDDNATHGALVGGWLRAAQLEPTVVRSGAAALDALVAARADQRPFDVAVIDTRMPGTDGLALAATIRARTELAGLAVVLLATGDCPADLDHDRQLGVDARLLKPVQQDELVATIDAVTRGAPDGCGAATEPSPPAPRAERRLRILVAEDNELNAGLAHQLLTRAGHRVTIATNGAEALAALTATHYDLLLLDLHMPELDGFGVIEAIRERERTTGRRLHVIAVTARSRPEDRERCLAAGMDDFVPKPIAAAALWSAIARVAPPDLLSARTLLAACGEDDTILTGICNKFRARLPEELGELGRALDAGDLGRARDLAHRLGGMAAAFSDVLGGLASELEDEAERGEPSACAELLDELRARGDGVLACLASVTVAALRERRSVPA